MKKILILLVTVLLAASMLVSCGDDKIGSYLENYQVEKKEIPKMTFDVWLLKEEGTADNAITTVKRMVNQYTESKFNTTLELHYMSLPELESGIVSAAKSESIQLVLITNPTILHSLVDSDALFDITPFFKEVSYGFATLNTRVEETLLNASKIDGKYYCVPNNHVIGSYEYIVINKAIARDELKYGPELLSTYTSYEATADLRAAAVGKGHTEEEVVRVITGKYEDKAAYEAEGNIVNIATYPTVTEDEVFSSAFGIVKRHGAEYTPDPEIINSDIKILKNYYSRVMEIVYALNADEYFHNLLTYGVKGTNYTVDEEGNVTRVSSGDNVFYMDPAYTGDIFTSYYCSELGWTKAAAENGKKQNADSVIYEEPAEEQQVEN